MKFGGHETFPLRDNWLFKGIQLLKTHGDVFADRDNAIVLLGVGTNMVKSIRHWLLATECAKIKNQQLLPNTIGQLIDKYDPYYDCLGSVWLLHYHLACNEEYATTWFWFFNKFAVSEFSAESVAHYLERYCQVIGKKVSSATLQKDINVLLRMYSESDFYRNKTPEDINICPLSRLSLLKKQDNDNYKIIAPDADSLPSEIFAYALIRFWQDNFKEISQFSFDELLNRDASPTKIFCLNVDSTIEILDKIVERYSGSITYRHAGGIFVIEMGRGLKPENFLRRYYNGENGGGYSGKYKR